MLLAINGGCFRYTDELSNTTTENIVVGEIGYTAKPNLMQESKEPVDDVQNTPQLFDNIDINSQTQQDTESSDIRNSENKSDKDAGSKNSEGDKDAGTKDSENKRDKDAGSENSENKSDKDAGTKDDANKRDKDAGSKNSENESDKGADTKDSKIESDKDAGNKNDNENSGSNVILEKHGLVELIKLDDSFVIDIKYATEDNFTNKKIYTLPLCLINKNTAKKLIAANNEFKNLGYRIKVFDAYRPQSAQQVLWDAAEDKSYVANPKNGSKHNRGAAVDVTLVDGEGQELGMPSGYDEFSERAHLKFNKCDEELIKNRELLGNIMVKHGFKRISTEWWHFDDTDALKYPLLDIAFEEFVE